MRQKSVNHKPSAVLRFSQEETDRVALHRTWQADPERLVESFNARLRDEFLNETLFTSLAQLRAVLAAWKDDYNDARPHSALGNLTPTEYTLRAPRPAPLLHRAH